MTFSWRTVFSHLHDPNCCASIEESKSCSTLYNYRMQKGKKGKKEKTNYPEYWTREFKLTSQDIQNHGSRSSHNLPPCTYVARTAGYEVIFMSCSFSARSRVMAVGGTISLISRLLCIESLRKGEKKKTSNTHLDGRNRVSVCLYFHFLFWSSASSQLVKSGFYTYEEE